MREISIVLSNIICNKICKRGAKKQMREGDTILKINSTLPDAKLKILLCSLQTKSPNLKLPITTLNITSSTQ